MDFLPVSRSFWFSQFFSYSFCLCQDKEWRSKSLVKIFTFSVRLYERQREKMGTTTMYISLWQDRLNTTDEKEETREEIISE